MIIDEEMKELREAINIESHIALQLNTLVMYVMQLVICTYFDNF